MGSRVSADRSVEVGLAVRELLRAGRHMQRAMGRRLALGNTELNAMDELVSSDDPLGPVELGNRLGIRSASATMLVDRLEAAGHLHRERHPNDRRRITLRTTDSARQDVRTALVPLLASMGAVVARLDDDDIPVVLGFLRDVTAAMREYAAPENDGDPQ